MTALVIGTSNEAIAAAAMLRRAHIPTETKWTGKIKRILAKTDAEVVIICGETITVRDMILREQREATMADLRATLADAFDGFLIDPRDPDCPMTLEAEALATLTTKG